MCVHVCVRVRVRARARARACVFARARLYVFVCVCWCARACPNVCACRHMGERGACVRASEVLAGRVWCLFTHIFIH